MKNNKDIAAMLQVARVASNKWAIASRGPGGQFSNKLLVLVDGRTVYVPGFSNINNTRVKEDGLSLVAALLDLA